MPNLPTKQNGFDRIRRNILNRAIENNTTRKFIANFMPNRYVSDLISFVASNDTSDFEKTAKIVASMNPKNIALNFEDIFNQINRYINNDSKTMFVDKVLEYSTPQVKDVISTQILSRDHYVFYSRLEDRLRDELPSYINFQVKTNQEISNLINMNISSNSKVIPFFLQKATAEQKKNFFAIICQSSNPNLNYFKNDIIKSFTEFSEDEKTNQYRKILDYMVENKKGNSENLTLCFELLPIDEKKRLFEDTYRLITQKEDFDSQKSSNVSRVIGAMPIEEQEKYVDDGFKYSNQTISSINLYLSAIDKNLHEKIAYDVFDSLAKLKEENNYEIYNKNDFEKTMTTLSPIARNKAIENVLKSEEIDESKLAIVVEALNFDEIRKDSILYIIENNLQNMLIDKIDTEELLDLFKTFDEESKKIFFKRIADSTIDMDKFLIFFDELNVKSKSDCFTEIAKNPEKIQNIAEILNKYSIKDLNEFTKGKNIVFEKEMISQLLEISENIGIKTLIFNKDVDKDKLIALASYDQLQNTDSINIDSVVRKLYLDSEDKGIDEFNQKLGEVYNLFTYNNVPEFVKNFRLFQLGNFYEVQNSSIQSFDNKTTEERDILILEDLFKISLDSNNESLRDFANILDTGKRITTKLQSNPEEKIKNLSQEELAILEQYRDTLIDMHNITQDIKSTDRPRLEKTDDIIKDLRTLISTYTNNKEHNQNSKNIVFNPNKIMDELFEGFTTAEIRPRAMLEYMESVKRSSDERHLEIEQELRKGTMHLQPGDFVKGIKWFDDYFPSMLSDGIKGGEFNQEHSHSDMTPLDADFGLINDGHFKTVRQTDSEIISETISRSYGNNFIVLKNYATRLKNRNKENFDEGVFKGSSDYYTNGLDEESSGAAYVRTGVPITDVDYIVSKDWNKKNEFEMAMAGIYIPVINASDEVIFSFDDYKKIREQMRGISTYGAEDLIVSKKVRDMDALYSIYKKVSLKSEDETEKELEQVKGLVEGKEDKETTHKKQATTRFIKNFFEGHGIKTTDDLSQNLSTSSIELIDTGSTGRGTNVPGDGDFDFMVRHNIDPEILSELSEEVRKITDTSSTGKFVAVENGGFRAKNVNLPTGEKVDIDVTTAPKSLKLSFSSDMCVRDRLNNIKEKNPDEYNYVQANIIMAKKILKAKGIYKKIHSDGATEHGGFGGIGVENWILQNGGSFEQAIDTYLKAANTSKSYDEFKRKYPIFDFGFNHREGKIRHDCFSNFLSDDPTLGFDYVKGTLSEIKREIEQIKEDPNRETSLIQSISSEGFEEAGKSKSALRNKFSFSKMRGMVAKFMSTQEITMPKHSLEEKDD